MFGVTSSGKTCFLYAMAKVLRKGIRQGDNLVKIISNRTDQQTMLNNGYMDIANRKWPKGSVDTETFDFQVSMQCNGYFDVVIDSLEIQDYRGGILQEISKQGEQKLVDLLESFRGSSAIIFIVDGQTLIDAMDKEDRDVCHRGNTDLSHQLMARDQIEFVENIFIEYKRVEESIPPIIIAISKGDIFASNYEKENGIRLIKESLPSIFATGSKMTAGITVMSLGEGLGSDENGGIIGTLKLNQDCNIHVPVIFGIYADLCYQYEETKDEGDKKGIYVLLTQLRRMFADRVELFIDGRKAREV